MILVDLEHSKILISDQQVEEETLIGGDQVAVDFREEVLVLARVEAKKVQEDVMQIDLEDLMQRHHIKGTFQRFACTSLHLIILIFTQYLVTFLACCYQDKHTITISYQWQCVYIYMRCVGIAGNVLCRKCYILHHGTRMHGSKHYQCCIQSLCI